MIQILLITNCGCKLNPEDIITHYCISEKGRKTKRRACPDHLGQVVKRKKACENCGKDFLFSPCGKVPVNCKKCTKSLHNAKVVENKDKRDTKDRRIIYAKKNHIDALNPFKCLNYAKFCRDNINPCLRLWFKCSMMRVV